MLVKAEVKNESEHFVEREEYQSEELGSFM
jgi:hypothetical protein